ncbi:hypothetical protein NO2_1536, partial [Candidatus Termititenax persephonae]
FSASGQGQPTEPLSVTLSFAPELLAERNIMPSTLYIDNGAAEILTVNYQSGEIVFRVKAWGDYALLGQQEYWAFDRDAPRLRFLNIKDGDYLDPAATLNVEILETDSGIDGQSLSLLLDGESYALPAASLFAGRLELRLGDIKYLPDGQHVLTVSLADLAGNTAAATLRFSTTREFQIENILPAPNPFGAAGVWFTYQLSCPAEKIEIRIYDLNGRLVRELNDCGNQTGFNRTRWDGRDRRGAFVANDAYLYVVKVFFHFGVDFRGTPRQSRRPSL